MSKEKAEALKEEGNALFVKKEYTDAAKKYSDAILLDKGNAVLYANRAACLISLNKYLDASDDAKKATELDPLYSKAWARLATIEAYLGSIPKAIEYWERALETLPKESLTAAALKQKQQYEAGLKSARRIKDDAEKVTFHGIRMSTKTSKFPWQVAKEMLPALQAAEDPMSSAWIIHGAYQDFSEGIELIMKLKKIKVREGYRIEGHTGGIVCISNGIMRDERVFHITDNDWMSKYNEQVMFESQKWQAWNEGGPDYILDEAKKRLRKEGWDATRPALTTTVRGYIMRGFLEGKLRQNHASNVTFLTNAIEILVRGKKTWSKVHRDDRGAIFDDTFIRGLRSMRLDAWMQAYGSDPGPNSKYPLEGLLEAAEELIDEIAAHPLDTIGHDPSFIHSFLVYPHSNALAMKGFCLARMAAASGDDQESYFQAGEAYEKAALILPEDDEKYAYFLCTTLEHYCKCGVPLKKSLEILERIRLSFPKMSKIWACSALAKGGGHRKVEQMLELEKETLQAVKQGKFNLHDPVALKIDGQKDSKKERKKGGRK